MPCAVLGKWPFTQASTPWEVGDVVRAMKPFALGRSDPGSEAREPENGGAFLHLAEIHSAATPA